MNTNITDNKMVKLLAVIALVCLICLLVTKPLHFKEHTDYMTQSEYDELDNLERQMIEDTGASNVYRYEKLVVKKYIYERYETRINEPATIGK